MIINDLFESHQTCPECGGPAFSDLILAEKKDACYHKVRSRYKVWPSAYASGALVQCRKKGAANWGNKSKNESVAEGTDWCGVCGQTPCNCTNITENVDKDVAEENQKPESLTYKELFKQSEPGKEPQPPEELHMHNWDEYWKLSNQKQPQKDFDLSVAEDDSNPLQERASRLLSAQDKQGVITIKIEAPDGTARSFSNSNPLVVQQWLDKYDLRLPRSIVDKFVWEQSVAEGLADEFMKMAQARGYNPRLSSTPEQERERTQQMLAQRAADREAEAKRIGQEDLKIIDQLEDEYQKMLAQYQSLGGSNWQYADREQNLTDLERQARAMEPKLSDLRARIARAEKYKDQPQEQAGMGFGEAKKEREADYGDEYQRMVQRVGQKAREQEKTRPVDIRDLARRLRDIEQSKDNK